MCTLWALFHILCALLAKMCSIHTWANQSTPVQQRAHFVQHILEQTSAHLCGSVLILCEFLLNIVIIHIMLACSQFLTAVSLCRAPYNPQKGDFAAAARRDLQTEKGKQREIWLIQSSCISVCKWRSQPARHVLVGGGKHSWEFTSLGIPVWFEHGPPHCVADHPWSICTGSCRGAGNDSSGHADESSCTFTWQVHEQELPETGSKLFYISSWAMIWPFDHHFQKRRNHEMCSRSVHVKL